MASFLSTKRSGLLSLGLFFASIGQALEQVADALSH
tara:strand:+ start:1421 stop:1528 length:108 start_codon:yes stop_codon:yes gene_type:complete